VAALFLYAPEELAAAPDVTFGGKAEGLLQLHAAGAPVPPWRVIPAEQVAARCWRRDAAARAALGACFRALNVPPFQGVAVRSSAQGEDHCGASLAGVFETRFADTEAAFFTVLDAVADAASSDLAAVHVKGAGAAALAIVLQAAVRPVLGGVLFSACPAAAHPGRFYVEVVHGHGSGLVGGTRTPSRFEVAMKDAAVIRQEPGNDGPAALPQALLGTLRGLLLACEERGDGVMDVEWAVDTDGTLWALQARPITALCAAPGLLPPVCAASWFFDQRFVDPITPITRTTLLPVIVRVAVEEALSLRRQAVPRPVYWLHGGQAYVAHEAYRRMFAGAPRGLLSQDLRQLFPSQCCCAGAARTGSLPQYAATTAAALLRHASAALGNLFTWGRLRRRLENALAAMRPVPPETPDAWIACWQDLDRWTVRFLRFHRWSLLWADYGYAIYRFLLRCMPARWAAHIEQRLRGEMRLVTQAANAALKRALAEPDNAAAQADLLEQHGHRAASLDYAAPTWAGLHRDNRLSQVYGAIAAARERAEAPETRRGPLSVLLWPLRRALELREEQRYTWERILARQRAMLRDAAQYLLDRGRLGSADQVFLLEWEELCAVLRGGAPPDALTLAIAQHARRVEARIPKPPFIGPRAAPLPVGESRLLAGTGASPGIARGRVRVLSGMPAVFPPPEEPVIAVLQALDPAWTIILPHTAGVVLERGGLLSHGAILAREYGVPLVVGVAGAVTRLKDGWEVTVDGNSGQIIINNEQP